MLQWWHPAAGGGTGLGARNNASDPHLWLPYLTARYVAQTGDHAILDEQVPFLEGPPIPPGAEGINFVPRPSREEASLYEHCCRAIDFTLGRIGPHGLPLIGSGDWNDGLSQFGEGGAGESVWLGFFLYDTLVHFAGLAQEREGAARAGAYRERAEQIRLRLDGMWHEDRYPRLIAGNGDAISWFDALMGSWPVLSGAVGFERGRQTVEAALAALERDHQVLLLTPYFGEHSPRVPGKIADYPPGVRENGGQYSHGSSWLVDALMQLADAARARGEHATAERLRSARLRDLAQDLAARQERPGPPRHLRPAAAPAAGRHLFRPRLRGPRRLELVHRRGRPDAHGRLRDPRPQAGRRRARARAGRVRRRSRAAPAQGHLSRAGAGRSVGQPPRRHPQPHALDLIPAP